MNPQTVMALGQNALETTLLISAPLLLSALVVGLIGGLIGALLAAAYNRSPRHAAVVVELPEAGEEI